MTDIEPGWVAFSFPLYPSNNTSQRTSESSSVILNAVQRNEESISLLKKSFWMLRYAQHDKNRELSLNTVHIPLFAFASNTQLLNLPHNTE
ncbi:MAG TPA: hypothetical protein ENL07_08975 [Chlorobaculum parvum]|uniref:Uncharacterized protein n=1 Tax=Chlorobaculum parvum TaxID=274539 RepID=A0A7C5DF22_9CHLB|nr:hypothetical protein [Chlorobaculum parvum]